MWRGKTKPGGLLYSKYHNSLRKLREEGLLRSSKTVETIEVNVEEYVLSSEGNSLQCL